ncbi:MAG: putative porin [Saprospiraceae bacterium]
MFSFKDWALLLGFILAGLTTIQAQRISTGTTGSGGFDTDSDRSRGEFEDQLAEEPDTFGVFIFFADNPNEEREFADTSLHRYFQQYDPARQRELDWRTLGNLGSAAEPFVYQPRARQGFDVGFHQFDLYLTRADQLPFYRLERAFTQVEYTQGSEQADGYMKARFSRNFANGLNFSLYYDKIAQIGRFDQYPNQNSRNTTFGGGMWFHSQNERYDGFLSIVANTIEQEDNGGLDSLPINGGQFADPSSSVVRLEDGQTRHTHREFSYKHYYRFGGRADSTGNVRRAFTLSHRISYNRSVYKFFDEFNAGDTLFYNHFPELLTDSRGARVFMTHREFSNEFTLSTFKLSQLQSENKARNQRDLLEIGLLHRYNKLEMEVADSVVNNLFLTGRLNFRPGPALQLNTSAHLGILNNVGDYRLNGELHIDLKKVGSLKVEATSQLYRPTVLQDRFYISRQAVWDNQFNATLENNFTASFRLPWLDLEVGAGYHLINNFIYFDTAGIARQTGIPLSITQLVIRKDLRVGHFHLDNTVALQNASESTIRLPKVFGKHSLYYIGRWFRVLDVKVGADVRYNTPYRPHYYNPFTGQFQLQDRQEVAFYPIVDAFFSMRVTRFRAFIKYENATSLFIDDTKADGTGERDVLKSRSYFQTANYLFPDAAIRFGISWRLLD